MAEETSTEIGNAQRAFQFFMQKGYKPWQAAGIVGNLMQESGQDLDPLAAGDLIKKQPTSFGVAQWRGDRLIRLKDFALDMGMNWKSLDAQLEFVDYELKNFETTAYRNLIEATDVQEATAAMIGYERPRGWTAGTPEAGHGWDKRLSYARGLGEEGGYDLVDPSPATGSSITPAVDQGGAPAPNRGQRFGDMFDPPRRNTGPPMLPFPPPVPDQFPTIPPLPRPSPLRPQPNKVTIESLVQQGRFGAGMTPEDKIAQLLRGQMTPSGPGANPKGGWQLENKQMYRLPDAGVHMGDVFRSIIGQSRSRDIPNREHLATRIYGPSGQAI